MLRDEAIQQSHAEACRPAGRERLLFTVLPGHTCDIEMGPGLTLLDEALEELRRGDRAAIGAADILHVRDLRLDRFVVAGPERHPPHRLARDLAGFGQARREFIVVGEKTGILAAE